MTDALGTDRVSGPRTGPGTVELWKAPDRLWRYRFLHSEGVVIRSNRSFVAQEEAVASAALAYPGVRIIELSEPPDAGQSPHPWRKLAIFSMITGGTGLIVVTVAKLLLFMRRLARRMKQLAESIGIAADYARRKR
ncbi:MAG: hypothetical protein E6G40_02475 [Actinobacteria bacterium]|nr:MAG: hypothetical protein E6G40_02475 [Actinomycetota bacterium]